MAYESYKVTADEIYSVTPYSWDGKSRPVLTDYVAPWEKYSALGISEGTIWSNVKARNNAIRYAQNMKETAIKQYEDDIAYWNERDERAYTTPSAQSQRYEDAGYNMGYMYSSVDSGNSAVGYSQSSYSPEYKESRDNSIETVFKILNTGLEVVTKLAKTATSMGVDITKMSLNDINCDYLYSLAKKANAEQTFIDLQSSWYQYLREHNKKGEQVSIGENDAFDWSESIAFEIEQEGVKLTANQRKDLDAFLAVAAEYYQKRNTQYDNVSPLAAATNNIQNSDMPKWLKTVILTLAGTLSGSASVSKVIK